MRRTITIRKFNTFLGLVVPAAALVAAGYVGPRLININNYKYVLMNITDIYN